MRLKKLRIFALFSFFYPVLFATMIDIKSSKKEIVDQQEIIMNIIPEAGGAVLKKHLLFSIDNPHLVLKNWKVQEKAQLEYVSTFRKEKKLYKTPVSIKIKIVFLIREKHLIEQAIKSSRLSVLWFELCKDGEVKSKHILVPLTKQILTKRTTAKPASQKQIVRCNTNTNDSIGQGTPRTESYGIKTLLAFAIICFVIALICFFEKSQRFITVQFVIGILLMCCALSFVTKALLIFKGLLVYWF
jgi:hypothetical protein